MSPVLQAALGSIVRWALAGAAGYLVKAGIWTNSDAQSYVAAASLAIVALGWSLWNKYKDRIILLTAIATPSLSTEADVKAHIATGASTPAVTTPSDTVPVPKA